MKFKKLVKIAGKGLPPGRLENLLTPEGRLDRQALCGPRRYNEVGGTYAGHDTLGVFILEILEQVTPPIIDIDDADTQIEAVAEMLNTALQTLAAVRRSFYEEYGARWVKAQRD